MCLPSVIILFPVSKKYYCAVLVLSNFNDDFAIDELITNTIHKHLLRSAQNDAVNNKY